jgi:tRNA U34 5-methylaminomethyl-2-thiouridine-forming methyltransferase MnmC
LFLIPDFSMIKRPEVMVTADGSKTLYMAGMDEQYHSLNGAFTESRHVFLNNGLLFHEEKATLNVLEIGFGTGLNALLTALAALERKIDVNYHALEKYPLSSDTINELDYGGYLGGAAAEISGAIDTAVWNCVTEIHPWFRLCKSEADLLDRELELEMQADVVYFDAFGPDKQPEMWTGQVFEKIYGWMALGGVIVTYSAKGEVRRRMASAGFFMERLPGPPGKREMLRGIKK